MSTSTPPALPSPLTIEELKKLISHDQVHTDVSGNFADSLQGRAAAKIAKANGIVSLAADDTLQLAGGRSTDLSGRMESLKDFEETIESFKKDDISTKSLEKMLEADRKSISKEGKKIFGDLGKATEYHGQAIELLKTEEAKHITALQKDFQKKLEALQKTNVGKDPVKAEKLRESISTLRENHQTVKQAVVDHFEELREPHTRVLSEVSTLAKEIEKHTGLNASEHMSSKAVSLSSGGIKVTEGSYDKMSQTKKIGTDLKANWEKGGFVGKAKVVIGAIGMVDGARRMITATSNLFSGDQQKIDEAGWGTLAMGAGELIGTGLIARSGGKGIATGKTQAI